MYPPEHFKETDPQDRSLEDQQQVARELDRSGNQTDAALAALMSAINQAKA
jgi:hypothetical protein